MLMGQEQWTARPCHLRKNISREAWTPPVLGKKMQRTVLDKEQRVTCSALYALAWKVGAGTTVFSVPGQGTFVLSLPSPPSTYILKHCAPACSVEDNESVFSSH